MEIWKPSKILPHAYEVSNTGFVRSLDKIVATRGNKTRTIKGRDLKLNENPNGRLYVILSDKGKTYPVQVHQLVCMTFMEGFEKGMELNHIDGNPHNNRLDNLELSNHSHNQLHAVRTGLVSKQGKSRYNNVSYASKRNSPKKWIAGVSINGKSAYWKAFETEEEAAKAVDVFLDSIGDTDRIRNFS